MSSLSRTAALLLLALVCAACACASASSALPSVSMAGSQLTNQEASRTVDLRSHIEESATSIKIKNTGSTPVRHYIVAVHADKAPRLAFIEGSSNNGKVKLLVRRVAVSDLPQQADETATAALAQAAFFQLDLPKSLGAGETVEVRVQQVFTRTQKPYPESIGQADQQLVQYDDSSLFFSPYPTSTQETRVQLASNKIESYTKKGARRTGDDIRYGPFTDVAPFARQTLSIHAANNSPFVTFTTMTKDIEVSHWGNVAVQDNYLLQHTGAKLNGEFTRFDYERSRNGQQAPASFRTLVGELPRTAKDIYYRDCIGNVSTSHVRRARDHTRLEVDPRFPMFGGWNSDFHIGYNLPSQNYLFVDNADPDHYVLNISFASPFASAAMDQLTVRVILPEGATHIEWSTPFDIDGASMTEFKTYLDTVGRPTLILSKANCVRHHQQNFQVSYRFARAAILREPLLVTGAVFACLLIVMAFYHADLRITDEEGAESGAGSVAASSLRSRRAGTELGARVQEALENLLARPNGLLAAAEDRSSAAAKQSLVGTLVSELGTALRAIEKEEAAFAPIVKELTASLDKLQKASKKYVGAAAAEAKAAREALATVVEQIHEQANKLANL